MGAVFAGSARAPITAVLIIFELTGDYGIILPLMFAVVLAAGVSGRLSRDTIYTLKLRRRGIRVDQPRVRSVMRTVQVRAAMSPVPDRLPADAGIDEVIARLSAGAGVLPVVGRDGRLVGIVSAADVEGRALADDDAPATAGELAHTPRRVRAEDTLEDAVRALANTEDPGLPVLDAAGGVAGWITHRDLLRAYYVGRHSSGHAQTARKPPAQHGRTPAATARRT
jgi:CIC family chloride channel protein